MEINSLDRIYNYPSLSTLSKDKEENKKSKEINNQNIFEEITPKKLSLNEVKYIQRVITEGKQEDKKMENIFKENFDNFSFKDRIPKEIIVNKIKDNIIKQNNSKRKRKASL